MVLGRAQVADDRCQQEAAADQKSVPHDVSPKIRNATEPGECIVSLLLFFFFVSRFLLYRKYRYVIFPESTKAPCEAALMGERHVRIEISDFVMRTFVLNLFTGKPC